MLLYTQLYFNLSLIIKLNLEPNALFSLTQRFKVWYMWVQMWLFLRAELPMNKKVVGSLEGEWWAFFFVILATN